MKVKDVALMAMMLALLVVASKISINIGPIPITFQTFAVIIMGFILKTKKALIVLVTFIVCGLLGLPFFSQGSGFAYVFMPSFGFMIGFVLSAFITGMKKYDGYLGSIVKGILGLLVIDVVGLIYMYLIIEFYMGKNVTLLYILQAGLFPFILKDIISAVLAGLIYKRVRVAMPVAQPELY